MRMLTIGKTALSLFLLVCVAAAPIGCLTVNRPPNDRPNTEVNVGGEHGVTVEHHNDK